MSKQWGHGYFSGFSEGESEGFDAAFKEHSAVAECEQMDMLIEMMASLIGKEPSSRHWALLRLMSQVNARHMFNAENAWHNRIARKDGAGQNMPDAKN